MSKPWKVLIADDEPAARRGVRQLLAGFPAFTVVGECRNGAEVLRTLESRAPDVIFLDVQMPGLDGFEVIRRRTPDRMPVVVFLTAWEQYALKAFDAQALDYLVKPVAESRFATTMKRLERQLASSKKPSPGGVLVTTSGRMTMLRFDEIEWIESADNYARLWAQGKDYLLREPLQSMEKRLLAHGFVRAHRRALLRLEAVRELVSSGDELAAVLEGGARVPVSRRRRAALVAALRRRSRPARS